MNRLRRFSIMALLCLLSAGALLSGCGGVRPGRAEREYYSLYFLLRDLSAAPGEGALRPEPSNIPQEENADPAATAEALLAALLRGPESEELQSVFPAETVLQALTLQGSRAEVDFSASYGTLSGVALSLADYAVTLTLTQIPEISLVRITVGGQELAYRDKQSFTARDVLLQPEGDVVGTVEVKLWFPDSSGSLVEEERTLSLYEGDTQIEAVLQAVEGGPENRELLPAFPVGFRVRSVWQEEDICFVNLFSSLLDTMEAPPSLALLALDRSLCSLESVRAVRYLVDGELMDHYGEILLTEPYGA